MSTKSFSQVSEQAKAEIRSKSAIALPDSPSASGLKAYDIKTALTAPIFGEGSSLLTILEKLITECEETRLDFENRISELEKMLGNSDASSDIS